MNGQSIRVFHAPHQRRNVSQVQLGIHALGHHVQCQRHDIDVPRPLSISEECPLDSVRAGLQGEFGSRDTATTIVMWMNTHDGSVSL